MTIEEENNFRKYGWEHLDNDLRPGTWKMKKSEYTFYNYQQQIDTLAMHKKMVTEWRDKITRMGIKDEKTLELKYKLQETRSKCRHKIDEYYEGIVLDLLIEKGATEYQVNEQ